jgi:hypothetical protein
MLCAATLVYTDSYEGGALDMYRPELTVGDEYHADSVYTPDGTITKLVHFCTAIERAKCELNDQVCPF